MAFPAVTICNLNQVMKCKRDTPDEDKRFTEMELTVSGCHETCKVRGNMTCGQAFMCVQLRNWLNLVPGFDHTTQKKLKQAFKNASFNLEDIYRKYGHNLLELKSQ